MNNELAFPANQYNGGMTLRDYFAAKIVVAFLDEHIYDLDEDVRATYATVAYQMADSMIEARK